MQPIEIVPPRSGGTIPMGAPLRRAKKKGGGGGPLEGPPTALRGPAHLRGAPRRIFLFQISFSEPYSSSLDSEGNHH